MSHLPFFTDLSVVAGAAVLAAILVRQLALPAVAGFMLAGVVVGPHGLGLVRDEALIGTLADVGVVLLLFSIGLEFSLSRIRRIGRFVAVGGSLQVALTAAATLLAAHLLGLSAAAGLFYGFMVALSSTAIVLRGLSERGEVDAPHGRFIIGALIFQDLAVVPMMLFVPLLAGGQLPAPAWAIGRALGLAALTLALTLVAGRLVVPRLFAFVDRARSREVFLLATLALCLGASWATAAAGLSVALGAFLAGVLLAESGYSLRAMGQLLPLRDVLSSLFFLSLGMLFELRSLLQAPLAVLGLFAAIFFGKAVIATLACMAMRFPLRVAMLSGIGLAQFGEFGFVLAQAGSAAGLVVPEHGRIFFAASLLTMFVTPLALRWAPHAAFRAASLRPLERLLGARGVREADPGPSAPTGHVVIAGFGFAGRLLASALTRAQVRYLIVDLNAEAVRVAATAGEPAYYGDIASEESLRHLHIENARALVMLINDPEASRRGVALAARLAPTTPIFVRSKYLAGQETLTRHGDVNIVSEEFEAAVEILARVLRLVETPMNVIRDEVRRARERLDPSARVPTWPRRRLVDMTELGELKIESLVVREGGAAVGRSAAQLALRSRSGALVVAVRRGGRLIEDPDPALPFAAGDIAYLVGTKESIERALALLE